MCTTLVYSQSPVYNTLLGDDKDGAYYKDTANELNKFEGTWLYTNGTTSFKLILQKKTMQSYGNHYRDLLVGGYQYIENGVEKVNYLNDVNAVYQDIRDQKVTGTYLITNGSYLPICGSCPASERILSITMSEPHATGRQYHFRFKSEVGFPDKIIIQSLHRDMIVRSPDEPAQYYVLPLVMDFTLEKQ